MSRDALRDDGLEVEPRHPTGVRRTLSNLGQSWEHPNLFSEVLSVPTRDIAGMVRGDSPVTSQAAAVRVLPKLSTLQAAVLAVADGRTDRALEQLPQFAQYAASTVRKRRTELLQKGLIEPDGELDGLTVWMRTK